MTLQTTYPDNSEIFEQKARGRIGRAQLSFAEKLVVVEQMKERVAPIIHARKVREQRERKMGRWSRIVRFQKAFSLTNFFGKSLP